MVNLAGLLPVFSLWDGKKTEAERKEDGLVIHAGMDETSMMLVCNTKGPLYERKTSQTSPANLLCPT